jgi:hypothetical protein
MGSNMNAHQLDANGVILNTIVVESLNVFPNLIDASVGGTAGDTWNGAAIVIKPRDLEKETAEQAASVRASRTEKLKDSDWTQINDSTADKAAWAIYRQALRDIPAQNGFPSTITWPTSP